jgi:hypothetical protein
MSTVYVLPSRPDPESEAIRQLLREAGQSMAGSWEDPAVHQARYAGGCIVAIERDDWPEWASVESGDCAAVIVRVDHHAPGDPGYGAPPRAFLAASAVGQVVAHLARAGSLPASWPRLGPSGTTLTAHPSEVRLVPLRDGHGVQWLIHDPTHSGDEPWCVVPRELVLVAAADHCLAAAYRGECPGVDPDELMQWRVRSRAAHQERPESAVRADIEAARQVLRDAAVERVVMEPQLCYCCGEPQGYCQRGNDYVGPPVPRVRLHYADLRGRGPIPELPEAACREGIPFLATARYRGRTKVVLQAAPPELVMEFLHGSLVPRLVDVYGDPARGFAGGYVS